jgi:hypothetical protein
MDRAKLLANALDFYKTVEHRLFRFSLFVDGDFRRSYIYFCKQSTFQQSVAYNDDKEDVLKRKGKTLPGNRCKLHETFRRRGLAMFPLGVVEWERLAVEVEVEEVGQYQDQTMRKLTR